MSMQDCWLNQIRIWLEENDKSLSESKSFSKTAFDLLNSKNWSKDFHIDSFVEDFFSHEIPSQYAVNSMFGQPPFTIYQSEDESFIAELYFWDEIHTTIHDHGFQGAFQLLSGRSVQTQYEFGQKKAQPNDCFTGELTTKSFETLKSGDSTEIKPGDEFIHRVLHLEKTTVSLILRTKQEPHYRQLNYFFHHIASPNLLSEAQTLKLRSLKWMLLNKKKPSKAFIEELLFHRDFWILLTEFPEVRNNYAKILQTILYNQKSKYLSREFHLYTLLKELEDFEDKVLLTAYESLVEENWEKWIEQNLQLSYEEGRKKLKAAITNSQSYQAGLIKRPHFLEKLLS